MSATKDQEVLAKIRHDLRAPLSAIRTAAELIERARIEGEQVDRVRSKAALIVRVVDRMDRLLEELIEVSPEEPKP